MNQSRKVGVILVAGAVALLGGLLAYQWSKTTQPPPAAKAPTVAAPVEVAKAVEAKPEPRMMPLGKMITIDDATPAPDRAHRMQYVEDMFQAEGLEVGDDATVTFHNAREPELSFKARITEVGLYAGRGRVSSLPVSAKPARQLTNEERQASLTFQDVVQGMDLQFDYDGRQVKEFLRLRPELVKRLQAAKAETLRITYRIEDISSGAKGQPLAFRLTAGDGPLTTTDLGPEQTVLLSREGLEDFQFPPAWVDGGKAGKTFLQRSLDLTEEARPTMTVSLPLSYLHGAKGVVTIDPTIIDTNTSFSTQGYNHPMVRGRDGTLYAFYRKYLADPNGGRSRHSVVWAEGKGNEWTVHGIVAPIRMASSDYSGNQYRPTACIESDGTIHVLWDEYYRGDMTGEGPSRYQIVHAYKPPDSDEFISTGYVKKNLGGNQHYAACAIDGHDNMFVTFYDSGRHFFGMWDPDGVSQVPQPPPPVDVGGTRAVDGSFYHFNSFTYNNSETSVSIGGDGKVYVRDARYYSGGPVWVGEMTNWVPGIRPSQLNIDWNPTRNINNSSANAHQSYTLLAPNRNEGGAQEQWYRTGDPGLPENDNVANRWRYTNPIDTRECFNAYNYYGDISVVPAGPDAGDIHYVTRIGIHTYTRVENFPEDPFSTCWPGREAAGYHRFYRAYYARFDASLGHWVDHSLVFGPNDAQSNRYLEHSPNSALATDGSFHVVAYRYSIPYRILYRRRAANGGAWDDWRSLMPGGEIKSHPVLRGSNFPLGGPLVGGGPPTDRNHACAITCTAQCAEDEMCGNTIDPETVDVMFTLDGGRVVYISTGQPAEQSALRRPLNHTYINTTTPALSWEPISTDQPGEPTDVCYKVEIASTPLFRAEDMVLEVPVGDPAWNNGNGYVCSDGYAVQAGAGLANGQYYYWRVTPVNAVGKGYPSEVFEMGVDTEAPAAFNLVAPVDGATPDTKTPTFQWQAACDPPLVRNGDNECVRP